MSPHWTTYAAYGGDHLDFDCTPGAANLDRAIQNYVKRMRAVQPDKYPNKPMHDITPTWYAYRAPPAEPV